MYRLGLISALALAMACGDVSSDGEFDGDGDGFAVADGDCDDDDPAVNPDATETPYNGTDDDCDGATLDDDLDDDGFSMVGGGDCDDTDPAIFPGADETPYDDVDQDCSGSDLTDIDQDGYASEAAGGDDCNDLAGTINPGATELPFDNIDQDCDGSDYVGADALIVNQTTESTQYQPSVTAYDGGYLVVWSHRDEASFEIWGRFLDKDGQPKGAEFAIRLTSGLHAYRARAAYDGTNFLVAWHETSAANNNEVYAQRIDASGSAVGGLLTIQSTANSESNANVAFNGTNYLVVWQGHDGNHNNVNSRIVAANGSLGSVNVVNDPGTSQHSYSPAVASDGSEFMVVWHRSVAGPTGADIFAMVVKNDGVNKLVDPTVVSDSTSSTSQPTIAFDGANYLVVSGGNNEISGQFIDRGGSPVLTASDVNFVISDAPRSRDQADVTYVDGYYMTSWSDRRFDYGMMYSVNDVYGQKVGLDASLLETSSGTNMAISATNDMTRAPRIASDGEAMLLVFEMSGSVQEVGSLLLAP